MNYYMNTIARLISNFKQVLKTFSRKEFYQQRKKKVQIKLKLKIK